MKKAFIDYTTDPATYYDKNGDVLEEGVVIKYVSTGATHELVRTEDGNLGYDATNPAWIKCGKAAPFEYGVYPLEESELDDVEIETTIFKDYGEHVFDETETDLEGVRDMAEVFLFQPVILNKEFPFIVTHPFSSSNMMPYGDDFIDISDEANANKWRIQMLKIIRESGLFHIVNILMNKPYRLQFLKAIMSMTSKRDFGTCLRDAWMSTENISMQAGVATDDLIHMFQYADPTTLMTKEEFETLVYFKKVSRITVYRGITGYNKASLPDAMSYTDNIKVAEWFATRFNQPDGEVIKKKIDTESILAYFTGRNESEVVINPYN